MRSVEEALDAILAQVRRLPEERVPLLEALGRTLAEDCQADTPLPPFDNSAVDGYAVYAADTGDAGKGKEVHLRTLADIPAGVVPQERVEPGAAARILTGAMLPPGADAIVMVEDTRPLSPDQVAILEAASPGQYIRRAGEDVTPGTQVLDAGTRLRAAHIGLLATLGRAMVTTIRPAHVAVVSTGDEVEEIEEGRVPSPGKIRNSNRYALAALVREAGAVVHSQRHIPDDPK